MVSLFLSLLCSLSSAHFPLFLWFCLSSFVEYTPIDFSRKASLLISRISEVSMEVMSLIE